MKLLVLPLLLISFATSARTVKLATITSDIDQDVTEYFINFNDNNEVDSMRCRTIMPNGGIFRDETVSIEEVMTDGAVMYERDGYHVVKLQVENFNPKTGGTVKLNYLFNAITGARSTKNFYLSSGQNNVDLKDQNMNKVNRMYFVANRNILVGVVGVKEIINSYVEKRD